MRNALLPQPCDQPAGAQEVKINLRARRADRDLIDRAAAMKHQTRTEFMLDNARQAATDALLDRSFFILAGDEFDRFVAQLSAPVKQTANLTRLMASKAPWDA
jgi:uncharacterized protein (DUF1778 family)